MEENFEINCEMPFGDGQVYIVGFDTMGEVLDFIIVAFVTTTQT